MTSPAKSANPDQGRRRSFRNREEVEPNAQFNPKPSGDLITSAARARELDFDNKKQTPSRRGARQTTNNNSSDQAPPVARNHQQHTNSNDIEAACCVGLSVDEILDSTALEGDNTTGSAYGLETYKSSRKRSKIDATTVEQVGQNGVDEKAPQRLQRKRTTKKDNIGNIVELRSEGQKIKTSLRKTKAKETTVKEEETPEEEEKSPQKKTRKRKFEKTTVKKEEEDDEEGKTGKEEITQGKPSRKRKTKEEKEAEAMPLAVRTKGFRMFIGAHVSAAKGVQNSVTNCVHIGGNAFALFLKSQRKWENPPLQDEHKTQFRALAAEHEYDATRHILPHGSYLVNLAQEDTAKASQAYTAFLDDLHRCEALGINLYNFHPGSTGGSPRPAAIARIASHLNAAHNATRSVTPLLETMAGGGNVIGATFADLRDIIQLVRDQSRIGVCLDTCHVFAAGYDLRSREAFAKVLDEFDNVVGLTFLKALHLNDSKAPLASHRDLHANIGTGFLGLRAFWNVMNEPHFAGLPMVLETPIDRPVTTAATATAPAGTAEKAKPKTVEDQGVWAREIKLLESLVGMDPDGDGFRTLEARLAQEGAAEREKHQEAFERKVQKGEKKAAGKRKRVTEGGGDDDIGSGEG